MQNRYSLLPRLFAAGAVFLLTTALAQAQQGFFNFTSPSPTIAVGSDCMGMFSQGALPTVTPTTPGATITLSVYSPDNPFGYTDMVIPGTYLIKWDVADNMGHAAQFEFGYTLVDVTPPVFDSMATPPILWVNSIAQLSTLGPIPATDNCSGVGGISQSFSQSTLPPLCQAGTMTRTWIATDTAGNAMTFVQHIQVFRDSLPPVITVAPQNGSAPCTALPGAYNAWLSAQMTAFTATDASGIATYTNNAPPALSVCPMPVTVTFTATDNCGYTKTATATFSSTDNTPPVVNTEPLDTIAYCGNHLAALAEFISTHAYASVSDACSPSVSWTMLVNGSEVDSLGVIDSLLASFNDPCGVQLIGSQSYAKVRGYVRIDFFAADICGNDAFVGQGVFGVIDTTGPVITGPAITTEECGSGNDQTAVNSWINAHGNATVTDNCSVTSWVNFSFTTSDGQTGSGNFNAGPYPVVQANNCTWYTDVTFQAQDDCGNTGNKTLRFQIGDSTPPAIGGFSDTTYVYCPQALPNTFTAVVTDNCSTGLTATYTTQLADTSCVGNYSLKVFWTATDACNNTGTRTQIFAVRDTVGPQFTLLPADITVGCDTFALVPLPVLGTAVQAMDACGLMQGYTQSVSDNRDPDPNQCGHYNFEITRTFVASDVCGNTRTATQVVFVRDLIGPTAAIALPDTFIQCQNLPLVAVPPPAADQCSPVAGPVTEVSQVINAGSCPDSYTITVTWKATDICSNEGFFSRDYIVIDTLKPSLTGIPPGITVECDAIPAVPALNSFTATDNCDNLPVVSFLETEIRNPDVNSCDHWSNYQIVREWTVTDACSNARTYTQTISVMDNTPPTLVIKDTVLLPNTPGLCGANVLPPSPLSAFDRCAVLPLNATLLDTVPITGPPSSDAVCDTVFLAMNASHLPPLQPVQGSATLTIFLDNADAEGMDEFFLVYGENGVLLGQTLPVTPAQCGSGLTNFTVSEVNLNDWLTDGQLTLTLVPNGTGPEAINPICPGRQVRAEINYQYLNPQVGVDLTYQFDNGTVQVFPTNTMTFLEEGEHVVTYVATDCVGNSTSTTAVIRIDDIEPPTISAPAAQTAYVGQNDCEANWNVPLPGITENCDLSGFLSLSSAVTDVKFILNANAGYVPQILNLPINGLIPAAFSSGTLRVRHLGDNSQVGEFFKVFDENATQISITSAGPLSGECTDFHETAITVSAAQINAWAANGTTSIRLTPNTDAANFVDFINPCNPINAQGFDGTSKVQVILEYNYALLDYNILNSNQQVVQSGTISGPVTPVVLGPGNYTVQYSTTDASNNMASASFALTVRDTVKPVALCQNRAVFTSVTGGSPVVLTPADINNGSYDNCSGSVLTYQLSQTNFTCNQAGQVVPVTLTVTDTSGNTKSCIASVNVNTEMITTSSPADICEGGMVQLFCDPPGNDADYTYSWTGPNFSSPLQNPVLNNVQLAQEGSYTVVVTGPTGCTAMGVTQLQLIGLPFQPALTISASLICLGQSLVLNTGAYSGTDVKYQWYRNSLDTLIATTIQPSLILPNPAAGQYQFFVRVVDLNCSSASSSPQMVRVQAPVAAVVDNNLLTPCEGDLIALGTPIMSTPGQTITYTWTGPFGGSSSQYPAPFTAVLNSTGAYNLVISANGCPGAPASVMVNVRDRPDAPVISGATKFCVGQTVQLNAQPSATGNPYLWVSPDSDTINTSATNQLLLNNVTLADSGYWKVIAVLNGCASPASATHLVSIQEYPIVIANANTPICQGGVLQFNADVSTGIQNYSWGGPSNFSAFIGNPIDNTPETGVYSVTVSTSNGCTATDTIAIQVVTPPVISSVTSNAPTCVDGSVDIQLFHTLATGLNGPYTYEWRRNGAFFSADPNPIIPTALPATDNGTYTLIVTDKYGCVSSPKSTTINVQLTPQLPLLSGTTEVCEGASANIQITNASAYPPGTVFIWQPSGVNQPVYNIVSASPSNEGFYTVEVLVGQCLSATSASFFLKVNKRPLPPAIIANTPVCEGDTLFLNATPQPNVTDWIWSGPAGFGNPQPHIINPIITPVNLSAAGDYFVQSISAQGCKSALGKPTPVVVLPRPGTPIGIADAPACIGSGITDTIALSITLGSQTSLGQYIWYNNLTSEPLDTASLSPVYNLTNFSGFSAGDNFVYVKTFKNGCESLKSTLVKIHLDTIPDEMALASNNFDACDEIDLYLSATPPTLPGISGRWSQLAGPAVMFSNPNSAFTEITNPVFGGNNYQFLWTLSNGACKNYSSDTVSVHMYSYEPAMAMADFDTCAAPVIQLNAQQGQTIPGYWSQSAGQADLNVKINEPGIPNTTVMVPDGTNNLYVFVWNIETPGCGASSDTLKVRVFNSRPSAGKDTVQCAPSDCFFLDGSPLKSFESGVWLSNNSSASFANKFSPKTEVCGLKPGSNQMIWQTNNGVCGNFSRDTITLNYYPTPDAVSDDYTVVFGEPLTFNILSNDFVPTQFSVKLTQSVENGTLTEVSKGVFTYLPNLGFDGEEQLIYEICNLNCNNNNGISCDIAEVNLNIQSSASCDIPSVITPNGDGINDLFYVSCLGCADCPQDNEVTIFNQWGDHVFHAQPYLQDWDGTYNGDPLPVGSYYYVVRYNSISGLKTQTGFIIIQR